MRILLIIVAVIMFSTSLSAFRTLGARVPLKTSQRAITITTGVEFDTIAREWRLKWSTENEKKSLADVQQALNKVGASLKKVDGVKGVQRIVCGGCQDYKVIVSLPADKWGAWVSVCIRDHIFIPTDLLFLNLCIVFVSICN